MRMSFLECWVILIKKFKALQLNKILKVREKANEEAVDKDTR